MRLRLSLVSIVLVLFLPLIGPGRLLAQSSSGVLRGQVVDPSGAGVPGATVSVSGPKGRRATAKTNGSGKYEIRGLAPGVYTVQVVAPNLSMVKQQQVTILPGRVRQLNISLQIEQQVQKVTVSGEATHLSVSPENNASALVLKGSALQALSDDPDEMESELEALAGPAAGPNGAQIYIDGFTGGQMPPKSDILEIHINQNPFSAEYDKVGYGRIEIITKPGASQFHGSVFADGNDSPFNSRSPFVLQEPPYHSEFLNGNVGGPLSHKASFFFDVFHRDINDNSVVSAFILNPNLAVVPFSQAVLNPQSRTFITPRLDYQLTNKNLLAIRYYLWQDNETNDGIGQFDLQSQAYNTREREQGLQLMDTQVISSRTVNETRFQYRYGTSNQIAGSSAPALDVLGAFTGGGDALGSVASNSNYFELRDIATMSLGKHTLIYGGRLRDTDESYSSNANFNGTFTFPTIAAYQLTEQGLTQGLPFSQIMAEGGGPSQFAISTGIPLATANVVDGSLYGEDQWRARSNLSLSLGLRFETQNEISDHADFAPRLGFAWGIGHSRTPKTVLRGGFGMFYDRFEITQVLQAEQLNGINQKQYVIANPDFYPTIPPLSGLNALANTATTPTAYHIDSSLQAPYTIQSAIGLERQISKGITTSVTYLNSHGAHQLLTRNINTPVPGEYNPFVPSYGRPFGNVSACGVVPAVPDCQAGYDGNIFQYESDGLYNQNELIANFSANEGPAMLFGFYTLNYANSDSAGAKGYVSNPYDILEDYGPSVFDIRDRAVLGGAINLPFGVRLLPFMVANSGTPFNV
ncbi:MAG: carboxypeptidase regulatory-like domain-containing protein, partial [Terriglobia bacterium]